MAGGVTVQGLRELQILFAKAPKEASRELRSGLRDVAEPIRADAESLSLSGIPRIGLSWSRMRVGVTRKLVYVAPRQRGVRGRGADPRRRPRFAELMRQRAMDPALRRNEAQIAKNVERLFDHLADKWTAS